MIKQYRYSDISPHDILNRDIRAEEDVQQAVQGIIDTVRRDGDRALLMYTRLFDKAEMESLEVTQDEIETAYNSMDSEFIDIMCRAAENIRSFHSRQKRGDFIITDRPGVVLGQKFTPLRRVGLYVPGGTASYPSSVLMNAIPATIAGVSEIVMVSPPDEQGNIPPAILAAAKIGGVHRIFKLGGAQAVAALAYGTQSVPQVDKIVGPGNIYVATAKRLVYGQVDIDMIAGPSEILVIADGGSNPAWVAADLLSQAEHDRLATAVLVTDSEELAEAVSQELERQIPLLPRSDIARESIDQNGKIVLVSDIMQGVEVSNLIAPEHLELCVDEPFALLSAVKNAGSIFLGRYTPEAMGDYFAGPNHTLPTSGTARFSSPLSVDDFVKKSSFLSYTAEALAIEGQYAAEFAKREGLQAHARSVECRLEKE